MRILILGGKGQLGRDLNLRFAGEHETFSFDLPELDIADEDAVSSLVATVRPECIVNAAAFTDVEGAEDHADAAFAVNETAAGVVARAAAAHGASVLYYSTDFVFDGSATAPYDENASLSPLSVYGRSKAAGEAAVMAETDRYFIVRTAWLYGPGGNNFVEKILRAAATRPALQVVDDEIGSPTHTWDLADATAALIEKGACGVYHCVNAGQCTRFDFARAILELAGSATPVTPCKSSQFVTKAARPAYSVLSTEKLARVTGRRMRPWDEALRHYMERRNVQ